jgi:Flp pilus assembly protein TadG
MRQQRPSCPRKFPCRSPQQRFTRQRATHAAKPKPIARAPQRGSITVWLLGLAVLVLFVGGLSLDLWRAFSARQLLANAADAAAIAGATGIDTARFRDTGQLALDPAVATQRAADSLIHQGGLPLTTEPGVEVTPDPPQVVVVLTGQVRLTLLRVLLPHQAPLTIRVRAASVPREIP